MKKTLPFMLAALIGTPIMAQEYLLNDIYTPPGKVAIDGGVPAPDAQVSVDDPFVTDYVLKRPVKTDYVDMTVAVGAWLNDEIRLHEVPSTGYAYASVNGIMVLADPNRQRIVKVYP